MITLEAVNEMLEAIGEPPVTTYTIGDGSDAAEAATILARETKRVLEKGWACNTDVDIAIPLPDRRFTFSAAAPTGFVYGEVLTESVSGATGYFECVDATNKHIYLRRLAGTFTGTDTLSGASASKATTAVVTVTSGQLGISDEWLSWQSSGLESRVLVRRGSRMYDASNMTYDLESDVRIQRFLALDITEISNRLARYCITVSALAFQKYKKRGQVDEGMIGARLAMDRQSAVTEDEDLRRVILTASAESLMLKGNRPFGRRQGSFGSDENYV